MTETKKITSLYVVTDSETSYDKIGDIDGGLFDDEWLKSYIMSYGSEKLIKKMAMMQMQVLKIENEIFRDKYSGHDVGTTII